MAAEPKGTGLKAVDVSLWQAESTADNAVCADSNPGNATGIVTPGDAQRLLDQAEQAIASVDHSLEVLPPGAKPFELADFSGSPPSSEAATLQLVRDVQLDLKIELGRTHMSLEEALKLKSGSIVPLDKFAGDPVDVYVNGRLIARGEVLVLNENFCVRVTELVAADAAA